VPEPIRKRKEIQMGEEEETEKNTPGDQESDRVKNRKRTKEEEGVVSDALVRVLLSSLSSRTGHLFYLFFPNLLCGFLVEPPFNIVKHKINK